MVILSSNAGHSSGVDNGSKNNSSTNSVQGSQHFTWGEGEHRWNMIQDTYSNHDIRSILMVVAPMNTITTWEAACCSEPTLE